MRSRLAGIAGVLTLWAGLGQAAPATQLLDQGWKVRLAPGDGHGGAHPQAARWLAATVPGAVQTDLMAADPLMGRNEAAIQWVGLCCARTRSSIVATATGA